MLENWLKPVDKNLCHGLQGYMIGKKISIYQNSIPSLKKVRIAILSDMNTSNDAWRKQFYSLAHHFPGLIIADLGQLRKNNPEILTPVLKDLISGGIFPIVITQDEELIHSLFLAYKSFGQLLKLLIIDEKVRYSSKNSKSDYINKLVEKELRTYLSPSIIGYQIHFTDPELFKFIQEHFNDNIRLGNMVNNIEYTEPVIRDADLLLFHLASIKSSDASGVKGNSPNGLSAMEACQLCRYAGFSDKLSSAGIFGYSAANDKSGNTAQLIAQMLWYIIDGFFHRQNEFPVSVAGLQSYIIEGKRIGVPLTFWKSKTSGRWWLQIPGHDLNIKDRQGLISCTVDDYNMALSGELPDRLVNALQKT
jgi:formiminoglutamase